LVMLVKREWRCSLQPPPYVSHVSGVLAALDSAASVILLEDGYCVTYNLIVICELP